MMNFLQSFYCLYYFYYHYHYFFDRSTCQYILNIDRPQAIMLSHNVGSEAESVGSEAKFVGSEAESYDST